MSLFFVLFGLPMDYHVFLLSRLREHYDVTQARPRWHSACARHTELRLLISLRAA